MKALGMTIVFLLCVTACSRQDPSPGLVNTRELGTVRGLRFQRVITHMHTPYSHDACDGKGLNADGSINLACLHDYKTALCNNHVNLTFNTDHVRHLADTDYSNLLLKETGDSSVTNSTGDVIATSVGCPDGFSAVMMPGLEGQLLALGMEKHVSDSVSVREDIYGGESLVEKNRLEAPIASSGANALVAIPHTESRDLQLLRDLQPAAIEIYNLHANLDPKIRKAHLSYKPFEHIAKFMNYLLDVFNSQNPDYLFVEFFQISPVYFQKWNTLLSEGQFVTGIAGHDSHENIFPQKVSDGERLDQHRRMTRMFSNLVLASSSGIDAIKDSIRQGKVLFVLEGLGTPIGFDFHATLNGSTTIEMGSTMTVASGETSSISFAVPSVISSFPGMDEEEPPFIHTELHYISSTGEETIVSSTNERTLIYQDPAAGFYRVHTYMIPLHLRDLVLSRKYAERAYPWIISNPIRVVR